MTDYQSIGAVQSPFEVPQAGSDRARYSCNYLCTTNGVADDVAREIRTRLVNAGIGLTYETNLFIGRLTTSPTPDAAFARILTTSGVPPDLDHSQSTIDHPSFQILVTGKSLVDVRVMAFDIYKDLHNIINETLAA